MLFNKKYSYFEDFIYRCPIKSYNNLDFTNLTYHFREALYLASPDLYESLDKIEFNLKNTSEKQNESIYKYMSRSSFRCTPFGSFSGVGSGKIINDTNISLCDIKEFKTATRIDMTYLCLLIENFNNDKLIRKQLHFRVNNSIYKFLNDFRYTEYKIEKNKRIYFLSEIESDEVIEFIIDNIKSYTNYNKIISEISNKFEFDEEEVIDYVDSLIDCQFLMSNLESNVSGENSFHVLINELEDSKITNSEIDYLNKVKDILNIIDNIEIGEKLIHYKKIENILDELKIEYNRQLLFQSDLYVKPEDSFLNKKIVYDLNEGISALNKIFKNNENEEIKRFKKDFYRRYESKMVPLTLLLDADTGIGLSNLNPFTTDLTPFLRKNFLSSNKKNDSPMYSESEAFLIKKLSEFKLNSAKEIVISDSDLLSFNEDWNGFSKTFSAFVEVLSTEDSTSPYIYLNYTNTGSAADLLSRFSHLDKTIENTVDTIFKKEKEIYGEQKILAEIVHLPQSRNGNILFRKSQREYEIPFLAKSLKDEKFSIQISDIYVGISENDKIILWSKKLNKEILPMNTNMYNYSLNPVLVHYFLCMVQSQHKQGLTFDWGKVKSNETYLPRVTYKKVILSPQTWNIKPSEVKKFKEKIESEEFYNLAKEFKESKNIPDKLFLINGDNKLLIDFENVTSVKILFKSLLKSNCTLQEYFNYSNSIIKDKTGKKEYRNEIIINYYDNN